MPKQSVEVVIVAYNSEDVLPRCLEALPAAAADCVIRLTIVDNASDCDVSAIVARTGLEARVLRLPKNVGYAGGNNIAIQQILATGPDPDAILILNPDVSPPAGSLGRLLTLLNQAPKCGAISPTVIAGPDTRSSFGIRSLWGVPVAPSTNGLAFVDRLPGCCMLVRPEVFRQIGLFDEAYFLYWEEVDLCIRARRAGYDLLISQDVAVTHEGDGDGVLKTHRAYYTWRNQIRFSLKNYGPVRGLAFLARRLLLANLREAITYFRRGKTTLVLSGLAGLWAGCRGEIGRSSSRFAALEQPLAKQSRANQFQEKSSC